MTQPVIGGDHVDWALGPPHRRPPGSHCGHALHSGACSKSRRGDPESARLLMVAKGRGAGALRAGLGVGFRGAGLAASTSRRPHVLALVRVALEHTTDRGVVEKARPVTLQINNSGAWKTIARFDAGDEDMGDKARAAGQLLGELSPCTLRIATDEPMPCVLMRWDSARGWWAVDATRQCER